MNIIEVTSSNIFNKIFPFFRRSYECEIIFSLFVHPPPIFFCVMPIIMPLEEICGEKRSLFLSLIDALDNVPIERETHL